MGDPPDLIHPRTGILDMSHYSGSVVVLSWIVRKDLREKSEGEKELNNMCTLGTGAEGLEAGLQARAYSLSQMNSEDIASILEWEKQIENLKKWG